MASSFSIRTAIFSIVLSAALWTLVSLRESYDVQLDVPISFQLPADRSIEAEVPQYVRYIVHASGWHLMNLLYLNRGARCVVDLSAQKATTLFIGAQELQQAFRSNVPAAVVDVLTKGFGVQLGVVGEKKVPLLSTIAVHPAPGYVQVGLVNLQPDSVVIHGNIKLLEQLSSWKTAPMSFASCLESQSGTIHVSDSLGSIISVDPSTIQYDFSIQRSAEITLDDIPIVVIGAPYKSTHSISPQRLSLTLRGGVDQIEKLRPEDIEATVEYAQVAKDTTGLIRPHLKLPPNLKVINMNPDVLIHASQSLRP